MVLELPRDVCAEQGTGAVTVHAQCVAKFAFMSFGENTSPRTSSDFS